MDTQGFEIIAKRFSNFSPFEGLGDGPLVSITKVGFTFSNSFCEMFGFKSPGCIILLHDPKGGRVGFKVAVTQEEQNAGYKLHHASVRKDRPSKACSLTAASFLRKKIDPIFCGKVYRASTAPGSNIITISLDSPVN